MTPAPSCCSGSSPPPTNAAPWASARTGPSTSGDGSCPSTPPPSACSTGCCTTASSSPPTASPTACAKPAPEEVTAPPSTDQPRGAGTLTWPPAGTPAWPLTTQVALDDHHFAEALRVALGGDHPRIGAIRLRDKTT